MEFLPGTESEKAFFAFFKFGCCKHTLLFCTDGIFNDLLLDWFFQQSLHTPMLLIQ